MDRITRISWNAFMNYFTSVVTYGKITSQDKYKLLVVYFFYYLLYKTYYAYDYIPSNEEGNPGIFEINDNTVQVIYNKFESLIDCLSENSCFIKPLEGDNCKPVLMPADVDIDITALIMNNCEWDEDPDSDNDNGGFIVTDRYGDNNRHNLIRPNN